MQIIKQKFKRDSLKIKSGMEIYNKKRFITHVWMKEKKNLLKYHTLLYMEIYWKTLTECIKNGKSYLRLNTLFFLSFF